MTHGLSTPAAQQLTGRSGFSAGANLGQHGPTSIHLPAVRENMELVGKLEVNTPVQYRVDPEEPGFDPADPNTGRDATQPAVVEGQIADVAIYKNAAYLTSWSEPSPARRVLLRRHLATRQRRASSRSCRRCPAPTTARARTS